MEEPEHHLSVGTEVSAKYRGAFCEAKIKSVKKSVLFRVSSKKDGKIYSIPQESIKGSHKVGSSVEVQLPESTGWHEGILLSVKDKSIYTVEFDDGDERTLSRGSLCLQGVRHFAEGDTLDQLPLTDPENFGTPVLNSKRKAKRKVTQSSLDIDDVDSDDQKSLESEPPSKKKSNYINKSDPKDDMEEISVEEKRQKWLSDELMGKLLLVEPTDKRKHWYPALCVNPLCIDEHDQVESNQLVVRSFKNGKFFTVSRCGRLTKSNIPSKVEAVWKDTLDCAFAWEDNGSIPDVWKADLSDTEVGEAVKKNDEADDDDEDDEKRQDFLEQLYKFMDDRGSPITKRPMLGYKDLDLFLLYNLVQSKGGFHAIVQASEWKEIYINLGIPKPTQAAGHHAKMAYTKYLLSFEEYLISFMQNKNRSKSKKGNKSSSYKSSRSSEDSESNSRRVSRRRKWSECPSVNDESENLINKEIKRSRKTKILFENKRDSDADDAASSTSSDRSIARSKDSSTAIDVDSKARMSGRKRMNSAVGNIKKQSPYKTGDKVKVKYDKDLFKLYQAKIVDVKSDENSSFQYFVHYLGWNSRHDEWIKPWKISGFINEHYSLSKSLSRRSKTPTFPEEKKQPDAQSSQPISDSIQPSPPSSEIDRAPESGDGEQKKTLPTKQVVDIQEKPKNVTEKKKRIRQRSTSSTSPPQPPSPKPEVSVEKQDPLKIENKQSSKEETNSSDEKQGEKLSVTGGVPFGIFPVPRRTSGRRSKSPAYLKDTALYGLTKRKRIQQNIFNESSNLPEHDQPQDLDDVSSETSSKSFNSSTSEASRRSPLTIWNETEQQYPEKNPKSERKNTKRKSDERKLKFIKEEKPAVKSPTTYDNFNDDVPNIELEKNNSPDRKNIKSETENPQTVNSIANDTEEKENEEQNENNKKEPQNETSSAENNEQTSSSSSASEKESTSENPRPETFNNLQNTEIKQSIEPPCNSKTLLDNTPPTTPEGSTKNFLDENETSSGSDLSACDDDAISTSSKNNESDPSSKETSIDEITTSEEMNSKQDKRSEKNPAVESDSDGGDTLKSNQRKSGKKKSKKKKRPEPPKVPVPLLQEDLALLTADERIQIMIDRMEELRKLYQQLKQEVSWIDRKRKRAKRKEQEAEQLAKKIATSPNKQQNDDNDNNNNARADGS